MDSFPAILDLRLSILDLGQADGERNLHHRHGHWGRQNSCGCIARSVSARLRLSSRCHEARGNRLHEDAVRLKEASGCAEPIEKICPYRFAEPMAPSIAAERAGGKIDVDLLLATYGEISAEYDITLVEGAGGLMVPLLPSYTYADFARVLKLPLLAVAANKLGVLNHLSLTLEHATCKGLSVLGYVLNRISSETSPAAETNREVLSGLTGVPCLGELPFIETNESRKTFPLDLFELEFNMRLLERVLLQQ